VSPARRLAVTVLSLLLAGLLLWVCTRTVWLRVDFAGSLRGPVTVPVTGAQLRPELGALGLAAVAAVAALLATGSRVRRVLGVLVALGGGWALWLAVSVLFGPGSAAVVTPPSTDAVPIGVPVRTGAPLLAALAAVLLLFAGVGTVCWARVMPGMGRRYGAPATARAAPDPDREWWTALDSGDDPTLRAPGTDPGPTR
jgi:uncharacterized membrane protein (TIGR02234 family)